MTGAQLGAVHVYGPVPSRRFGLSLGIDLLPHKTCCYDCTYCQVGPTTRRTTVRACFVDPDEVVREVERALEAGPAPDLLTLAGSGEPTLYSALDELVEGLRRVTRAPLALITNGALLDDDAVARQAARFDLVAPSLDAADPETWAAVNRPAPGLELARLVEGLVAFARSYRGLLRLEVMLAAGVNDSPEQLSAIAAVAARMGPVSIDLNTVVRPTAHGARRLDEAGLERALEIFGGRASVIVPFRRGGEAGAAPCAVAASPSTDPRGAILETLRRRPCTLADLCDSLGLGPEVALAECVRAAREGLLEEERHGDLLFYRAVRSTGGA
jgi:wyosine [tRNA(Phe)-imidazoG37] synthetase (radical SAM superfamily)